MNLVDPKVKHSSACSAPFQNSPQNPILAAGRQTRTGTCTPRPRRLHHPPGYARLGTSDKLREEFACENSAHSRAVAALIDHLQLDAVDVIGFSMGCGTTAGLLAIHPA